MADPKTLVQQLIDVVTMLANQLAKLAVPVIIIVVILEVVFGLNMGLIGRTLQIWKDAQAAVGLTTKEIILWGIGAVIVDRKSVV